jgi:response regulator of citrate/malate metabolism
MEFAACLRPALSDNEVREIYSVYFVNYERAAISDLHMRLPRLKKEFEVVGVSSDADVAINEIISMNPDLVITDLYTKTMTGNALVRRLRQAGIKCEFIIYTDIHSHDDIREFFTDGRGYDYWLRPLDTEETDTMLVKLAVKLSSRLKAV